MAFRHWLDSDEHPPRRRPILTRLRAWAVSVLPFLHITTGVGLIAWGLHVEDWVDWRITAGVYVLSWSGWLYLYALFRKGIYMLNDDEKGSR